MRIFLPKLLLVASLFSATTIYGQALTVGGLAFTGYNRDDNTVNGGTLNDDFSFVLLQNIGAGTTVFFTDLGWLSGAGGFQNPTVCPAGQGSTSDGIIQWSTSVALPRGTHVRIRCRVPSSGTTMDATVGTATGVQQTTGTPGDYMALGPGSGDQIFAYTGSFASPTLIAGIDISGTWETTLNNCDINSAGSVQPPALTTNNYSFIINPERDNGRLKQTIKLSNPANAGTDRANIHNQLNWDFDDVNAFALPGNLFILPVNFTFIKAAEKGGQVQVDFGVGTESDIIEYVVERSGDGRLYSSIGSIQASRRSSYSFADIKPLAGTNFYRIRTVELNGSGKYSTVANINLSKAGKGIGVYPGIVRNNQFTLQITNLPAGSYRMNIHSAVGQLILSRTINHAGGSSTQTVNLPASTQKGVYRVRLAGDAESAVSTIVIE